MQRRTSGLALALVGAALLAGCASSNTWVTPIAADRYPAYSSNHPVEVFRESVPQRPFVELARVNVQVEQTGFVPPSRAAAEEVLIAQARKLGADALIDVKENRKIILEARALHLRATAIRYRD